MNFRRWSRFSFLFAFALTLVPFRPAAAAGPEDVLNMIPDDTWGFLVLRSLDVIDQRAKMLNETLGLNLPTPITPMALAPFNIADVIDMKSPLCVIAMDMQKFGETGPDSAIVMLVPTKDPKAMLEKLNGKDAQDGITKCTVMEQPAFAAVKDKYIILGKNQDCVTKVFKTEKTLSADVAKARKETMSQSDIFMSFSVNAIFSAYKDRFMPIAGMMLAAQDPEGKTVKQMTKMFTEMTAADVAIGLDKNRFAFNFLMHPKKGSDLSELVTATKNSSESLVSCLPKEDYLFAFGGAGGYNEHSAKFGDQNVLGSVFKSAQMQGIDQESVKAVDSELAKIAKIIGPWGLSLSDLGSGPDGMFGIACTIETSQPKDFLESLRKIYKSVFTMSDDEDFQEVKKSIVHKPDAETVGDDKVDTVTVDVDALAKMSEMEAKDLKTLKTVVGNFVIRFGAIGDKHVVLSVGGGKDRYAKVGAAVKASKGSGLAADTGISTWSKMLTSPRSQEMYFAIDRIARSMKTLAKSMGEEDEIPEVPQLDAPIALSVAQVDGVSRMDFVVPMKLAIAVKKAIEEHSKAGMQNFDEDEDDGDKDHDDAKGDDTATSDKKEKSGDKAKAEPKADKAKSKPAKKDKDEDSDGE